MSEIVNAGGLSHLRIPKSVCRFNTYPGVRGSMSMRWDRTQRLSELVVANVKRSVVAGDRNIPKASSVF